MSGNRQRFVWRNYQTTTKKNPATRKHFVSITVKLIEMQKQIFLCFNCVFQNKHTCSLKSCFSRPLLKVKLTVVKITVEIAKSVRVTTRIVFADLNRLNLRRPHENVGSSYCKLPKRLFHGKSSPFFCCCCCPSCLLTLLLLRLAAVRAPPDAVDEVEFILQNRNKKYTAFTVSLSFFWQTLVEKRKYAVSMSLYENFFFHTTFRVCSDVFFLFPFQREGEIMIIFRVFCRAGR